MEYFYFHNCLYEFLWKDNKRRWTERTPTWDVLHKYPADYKVVFVGDASMSPRALCARRTWRSRCRCSWIAARAATPFFG